ncbi:MAG: NADH-quinone oxidoreductase subunit NuoN [Gammaproteobacteria bacterium]|nr:NADH-quinone oxidoreductase subunit NuoN [Gammaproteobacteria bacterium]
MTFASLKVAAALPEIFLAVAACAILLFSVINSSNNRAGIACWFAVAALLITALLVIAGFPAVDAAAATAFNAMFIGDALSALMKVGMCLLCAAAFLYGREYNRARGIATCEYYVLGLFSAAGMLVMASANHLLTLYLGLELMSLCLYALVASARENKLASEAAMKYFVLGALASSILLYGMSLLYGLTGALELPAIRAALVSAAAADAVDPALALAVVFIVVALAFKLGAAPFHMWLPDVYHGAPTSTTAFLSAAPKIAAFAVVLRLLADGLGDLTGVWQSMLIILALLSVAVGNFIAIAQSNLKRMLAYSAVSHMGFFLFGIAAGNAAGYSASLFYVLIYAVMSVGAFGAVLCLARDGSEFERLDDLRGLSKRQPRIALLILILMLSMAGIPPTAGFFAKLAVIQALVGAGLVWVAVAAVLLAVVGAFYYLRVIKLMYFDAPAEDAMDLAPAAVDRPAHALLAFNALIIIAILPWIGALIALCNSVIAAAV